MYTKGQDGTVYHPGNVLETRVGLFSMLLLHVKTPHEVLKIGVLPWLRANFILLFCPDGLGCGNELQYTSEINNENGNWPGISIHVAT